jgi:hypothetical protein
MAARDEGHGICMHMGIDRWVFEVVKSPWGTCIFAISVTLEEHNAKSPKQDASAFKRKVAKTESRYE